MLSEGAVHSVCAGVSGREPPQYKRGGLARPLMYNDVLAQRPSPPETHVDVWVATETSPQARNRRRRERYRSDLVRDGPSGVTLAPEGALSQQPRTKMPLRRQILAEAAFLAEKHVVTRWAHHPSAQAMSGARAATPWAHGSSGTAGSPRTRRKPPARSPWPRGQRAPRRREPRACARASTGGGA